MKKLVRDLIPKLIRQSGRTPIVRQVTDLKEQKAVLFEKLDEEVQELKDGVSVEELCDVMEVLSTIALVNGWTPGEIVAAGTRKRWEKGGFSEFFICEFPNPPSPFEDADDS